MNFTTIPVRVKDELHHLTKEPIDYARCAAHPSDFMYHFLGLTPYRLQHLILRRYRLDSKVKLNNSRIMICKPRQVGISWMVAGLAVWAAFNNVAKSGPFKDTKIGIISRSDKQAIKLMGLIQKLIYRSPLHLDNSIINDRKHPLNKTEIHFRDGYIKCYPPTDACRGETFDWLIIDEAAFVDAEIYKDAMYPTISKVDGKIILSSTPRGQKGMFFEEFDPDDMRLEHEYERFWFNWKMCEDDIQLRLIKEKLKYETKLGNIKHFEQEYGAQFTVDEEAFFEDKDVEAGIDKDLTTVYEWKETPCAVGLDYGVTTSATVLTVTSLINGKVIVLWQYAQVNFDENLLMDPNWEHSLPNLKKRYNLINIVVDDCPIGNRTNKQLENEGYPVKRFNFKSDTSIGERNRGYYLLRSNLRLGKVKYPNFRNMTNEMKSLLEIQMEKYMKIKAPRNYRDDRADSLMMACLPFLSEDSGSFKSILVEYKEVMKKLEEEARRKRQDGRYDEEYGKLDIEDEADLERRKREFGIE